MSDNRKPKRIARALVVRRYNCLAPPAAYSAPAGQFPASEIKRAKVSKSGSICISGLPSGARVQYVQAAEQTYIVSALPEKEIRKLAEALPKTPTSAYASLGKLLEQRSHDAQSPRIRHGFVGPVEVPQITEEAAMADSYIGRRRAPR